MKALPAPSMTITVTDHGSGISPRNLKTIFQALLHNEEEGHGPGTRNRQEDYGRTSREYCR